MMRLRTALLAAAVLYSAAHFVFSGVLWPLQSPSFGQIQEEMVPVQAYLEHGRPVKILNPRQYGPTFFFVLHPLLRLCGHDAWLLSRWLYAIQLLMLGIAFSLCTLGLRLWLDESYGTESRIRLPTARLVLVLTLLWANFAPLYTIVSVKNVEMWELCLIAAGLYCSLRRWRFLSGVSIAAAGLTKMLPLFFFLYFLLRDRRAFGYACLGLFSMLAMSHALYGPDMGARYLAMVFGASLGNTWALTWHENVSLKGMVVKLFGHLEVPAPDDPTRPRSAHEVIVDFPRLANVFSHLAQAAGLLWTASVILSRRLVAAAGHLGEKQRLVWEWSVMSSMMLVLSPSTAYEYMVLALPAFSFVAAALAADAGLRARWDLRITVAGAILLVANIVPRQVMNRIMPIGALNRLTGYTHLAPSEGYQYYGFPFFGLLLLVAALCIIRSHWARPRGVVNFKPTSRFAAC